MIKLRDYEIEHLEYLLDYMKAYDHIFAIMDKEGNCRPLSSMEDALIKEIIWSACEEEDG